MADINQIVTLGIGTPADIEHFVLVGLNANPSAAVAIITEIDGTASYAPTIDGTASYATTIDGVASTRATLYGSGSL